MYAKSKARFRSRGAWRGVRNRKARIAHPFSCRHGLDSIVALGVLGFPAWYAQNELNHANEVANAVGEWRDPVDSAYELRASLNHWRNNREPGGPSFIANLLGFPTTEGLARKAIYVAARRLLGESAYATLQTGDATANSEDVPCYSKQNAQIPPLWPDSLKKFVDSFPKDLVYCLVAGGENPIKERPQLLVTWDQKQPIPGAWKLFWYCASSANVGCNDWEVALTQMTVTGLRATEDTRTALLEISNALHDGLLDLAAKGKIRVTSFGSIDDEIVGSRFFDRKSNKTLTLTVVFGVSQLRVSASTPPSPSFMKCEPSDESCSSSQGKHSAFRGSRRLLCYLREVRMRD